MSIASVDRLDVREGILNAKHHHRPIRSHPLARVSLEFCVEVARSGWLLLWQRCWLGNLAHGITGQGTGLLRVSGILGYLNLPLVI